MRSKRKKSDCRGRAFHGADEWSRKAGEFRRAVSGRGTPHGTDKRGQTGKIVSPYRSERRDGRELYAAQRAITCERENGRCGTSRGGGNKGVWERIVIRERAVSPSTDRVDRIGCV
jgi:hypothetical protein